MEAIVYVLHDHRRLNKQTTINAYQPALAQTCIDLQLAGSKSFSAPDLRQAYHTVRLRESDIPKTQFICKQGTFSFTRMTFGLVNAPASCRSRAIDLVFS
jgi:hypothetical protein